MAYSEFNESHCITVSFKVVSLMKNTFKLQNTFNAKDLCYIL